MGVLVFDNGSIATVEGTVNVYPQNLEETLYLFGEKGTVKLGGKSCNAIDVWSFSNTEEKDTENVNFFEETSNVYGNGHISLYKDMIESIIDNHQPYVNATDGKNALEVVLSIYKSQLSEKAVILPLTDFGSDSMKDFFKKQEVNK